MKAAHGYVTLGGSSWLLTWGLFHERILDLCLSYNLSHDLSKKVRMT